MPTDRDPKHKAVVTAIIDAEVEVRALVLEVAAQSSKTADRLKALARQIVHRRALGQITADRAMQLFEAGMEALLLLAFVPFVKGIKEMGDAQHARETRVVAALGAPLNTIAAIDNIDLKQHATEKAMAEEGKHGA